MTIPIPKGFQGAIRTLKKRAKLATLREHGRKMEEAFFGPGGEFEDEAAAKRRKNQPLSWSMIVDYLKAEGWKPLGKKGVAAFGRTVGSLYQVLQLEAHVWRVRYRTSLAAAFSPALSLGTYHMLDRALIAANRQANDYLNNPGRPHGTFRSCVKKVSRRKLAPGSDPKAICGATLNQIDTKTVVIIRRLWAEGYGLKWIQAKFPQVSSDEINRALQLPHGVHGPVKSRKRNPITLNGNPPKPIRTWSRIGARVEGVIYNRVLEIQAEKTGDMHKGFWYHPFKRGSDVQMLALDTGDILIHSKAGNKLWREDRT